MYWKLTCEPADQAADIHHDGRFVLHRHVDQAGAHLDLRIEHGESLQGWRIDGLDLESGAWATDKGSHPCEWLSQDGDAIREDEGTYQWLERTPQSCRLVLRGRDGEREIRLVRTEGLAPSCVRDLRDVLDRLGRNASDAARLVADGVIARQRAIARLCGLGRELDGDTFNEDLWRRTLDSLTLDEIHAQLRGYEVRLDAKYPPDPISKPDPLPDEAPNRTEAALTILRTP